jgi:hypothetical protein
MARRISRRRNVARAGVATEFGVVMPLYLDGAVDDLRCSGRGPR